MVGSLLLALLSSLAIAKTPERILAQVSPSVVGIDVIDAHGKSIGRGSGVVIGEGQVITSCRGIKEAKKWQVHRSGVTFNATLQSAAPDRDLCQLNVPRLQAPDIALGTAEKLGVGQRIYAVGAPTERKRQEGGNRS
ncbi:MAG: S1 family peptidase [Nitrosospira sp.]